MKIKKYRLENIITVISVSVLVVSIIIMYVIIVVLTPPFSSLNGSASIHLEKVELNETTEIEYVEIVDSDLEQYPSLAKAIDAWENPDKYENAHMWNNKTLIYEITGPDAENLVDFIQDKFFQKYSRHIGSPYYIEYNQEFYTCRISIA